MEKKYKYTLGIDPSGTFKEGKGTTGWCLLDGTKTEIINAGTISAMDYNSYHDYWDAHLVLLEQAHTKYGRNIALSIEDYILYKNCAMSQVNSQMETIQLIGIIKHYCYKNKIPYFIRPASAVKNRWTDDILVHKGILKKLGRRYFIDGIITRPLCEHERDAIRHAVHFNTFENKKEK